MIALVMFLIVSVPSYAYISCEELGGRVFCSETGIGVNTLESY